MNLLCEGIPIHLLYDNEKNSMLIAGGSRMGKTYFISNWAASLICLGKEVHFIELGGKWSNKDKQRLQSAGAVIRNISEGITLIFSSVAELLNCAQYILNALGIRSINAITILKKSFKKALDISVTRPHQHRHLKRKDSIRFLVLLFFSVFFILTG